MIFFPDSDSLKEYVRLNNVLTWNGAYGMGNLGFIDSHNLHVVFSSRTDYEKWDSAGRPVCFQLSLF